MNDFIDFISDRGFDEVGMGPDPAALTDKVGWAAATGTQRSTHLHKYQAELLVEGAVDEADHLKKPSPVSRHL